MGYAHEKNQEMLSLCDSSKEHYNLIKYKKYCLFNLEKKVGVKGSTLFVFLLFHIYIYFPCVKAFLYLFLLLLFSQVLYLILFLYYLNISI